MLQNQQIFQQLVLEMDSILEEIRKSVLDVKSTQNDAISTLSDSFASVKSMAESQNEKILTLFEDNKLELEKADAENISDNTEELQTALNGVVRSLQFDDINTQNLIFVAERISFLQTQLLSLISGKRAYSASDLSVMLHEIKEYRESRSNPVTSKSVDDGGVDLF